MAPLPTSLGSLDVTEYLSLGLVFVCQTQRGKAVGSSIGAGIGGERENQGESK